MALGLNCRCRGKFLFSRVNNPCRVGYQSSDTYNNHPSLGSQRRNCSSSDDNKPAKCKVALVTGGARGIGYHIADQLLANGAQAVIIGDVLVDECEKTCTKFNEKYGENKALFQPLDVTKKDQMDKIFKCTKDRFGKIDIVVNNAGILADKRWEDTIAINISGVVYGTLLGFQYMTAEKCGPGGFIINVSSILGLQPLYSSPVYVGTKHFGIGFSRSMGHEYFYKKSKVKVMAVCPGVTDTNMITEAAQGGLPGFGDLGKELASSLGALPAQPRARRKERKKTGRKRRRKTRARSF
ncbi:unnamed protein product [Acanthoscelides obtectus]|uniref:Uncharacterized protein n=1 Tax=Acanthoscelides obtectus TaxID=200917 RepID=A0A9P0MDU4_ACAOB|nr:unnamed protein product [Acanthoscelides obtectus]CAK1659018.1 15-hydroxyprostaglandin dehydrogenase [NAD(+)] [Acanthoscelides obtectus]